MADLILQGRGEEELDVEGGGRERVDGGRKLGKARKKKIKI